ncbi:hypothetical protein RJ640_003145 [Escallonia rubra]|uniref:Uncharacterized protein n=1 Tax=Escallonia rubra TaxID=112253 RepID=A0AA88UJ53_9ASTE|nr:hypothetical protein RJ640_003145 [Escallonia rubra]
MGSRAANVVVSRASRIKAKLQSALEASALEVEDVSYQHAGHAAVKGDPNETHFNVKVVSNRFDGQSLVKRHRMVYDALADELQSGLHALSIRSGHKRIPPSTSLRGMNVSFIATEDSSGHDGGDGQNEEVEDCSQRNQVTLDVDPWLLKTVHDFRKLLGVEFEGNEKKAFALFESWHLKRLDRSSNFNGVKGKREGSSGDKLEFIKHLNPLYNDELVTNVDCSNISSPRLLVAGVCRRLDRCVVVLAHLVNMSLECRLGEHSR